jgi:hypothetical protein
VSFGSFAVNFNGNLAAPAAATPKISLFPSEPNALYCDNCYMFITARLVVNLQVCGILQGTCNVLPLSFYYDASLPKDVAATGNGYFYSGSCYDKDPGNVKTSDADARARTDCAAIGTATPYLFNLGMAASAVLEGGAGFNFAVKSDGIPSALSFPSTCSGPVAQCTATQLPGLSPVVLPEIVIDAGIPVYVQPTITLKVAASAQVALTNFKLQLGASASVVMRLGGSASFKEIPNFAVPALTTSAFSTYTATFTKDAFFLGGFDAKGLSLQALVAPTIDISLWRFINFTMVPAQVFSTTLAKGAPAGGTAISAAGRALQGQACSGDTLSLTTSTTGSLGVVLNPLTLFGLVKAVTGLDIGKSTVGGKVSDYTVVPTTTLLDPGTASYATSGALDPGTSQCVTVGKSVDIPAPSSGAAPGAKPLAPALAAAVAVGVLLLIVAVAFLVYVQRLHGAVTPASMSAAARGLCVGKTGEQDSLVSSSSYKTIGVSETSPLTSKA